MPSAARAAAPLPRSPQERELVGRFADAFQAGDVEGVVALLTDDAWLTMPPEPLEYQGAAAIGRFLSTVPAGGALERVRLVPTRANLQPAFGCYLEDPHAPIAHAYGLMVLTLSGDEVARSPASSTPASSRSSGCRERSLCRRSRERACLERAAP